MDEVVSVRLGRRPPVVIQCRLEMLQVPASPPPPPKKKKKNKETERALNRNEKRVQVIMGPA